MDFLNIKNQTPEEFERIAQTLFDKYAIQTKDTIYRMIELEFYWNSPTHKDNATYKRLHVDPKQGDWFFHYSGVDIALRNDAIGGYGGILIRGLYDINAKKIIRGPMVCAMKLFSGYNAFSKSIETHVCEHPFDASKIVNDKRKNLGKNAQENGFDKMFYAFSININAPNIN